VSVLPTARNVPAFTVLLRLSELTLSYSPLDDVLEVLARGARPYRRNAAGYREHPRGCLQGADKDARVSYRET
jgi:hypothetical protein